MSKRVDHGLEKARKKRARPAVTHRPVHSAETAAERARTTAGRTPTIPHALAPDDDATPQKARKARRSVGK